MINTVLGNKELRTELKRILGNLIPDIAGGSLNKSVVEKVLQKAGITKGILVDLGCGTGENTEDLASGLDLFTLGLDRQYHRQWYDPHWREACKSHPNLGFVLGDFAMGIPLKEECADAAIFQYVAQHITQGGLEKGLKEALRVLRNGGYLFVGPQCTSDYVSWRIFKKEATGDGQISSFKEYKYYDIVPEDKPKRWHHKKLRRS